MCLLWCSPHPILCYFHQTKSSCLCESSGEVYLQSKTMQWIQYDSNLNGPLRLLDRDRYRRKRMEKRTNHLSRMFHFAFLLASKSHSFTIYGHICALTLNLSPFSHDQFPLFLRINSQLVAPMPLATVLHHWFWPFGASVWTLWVIHSFFPISTAKQIVPNSDLAFCQLCP